MNAQRKLKISQSVNEPTNKHSKSLHRCKRTPTETILSPQIVVTNTGQARDVNAVNAIGLERNNVLNVLHAFLYY